VLGVNAEERELQMEEKTISQRRDAIKKTCKLIHVFLTLGTILWAFLGIMTIIEDVWTSLALPMETIIIGTEWLSFNVLLLGFEGTELFIPIIKSGWIPAGIDNVVLTTLYNMLITGVFLIFLLFLRSIFNDLKNGGSPFSRKISFAAYAIAIFIASNTLHGPTGRFSWDFYAIFPALLIGLIGFIFDYGRVLQEESDTTL